VLEVAWKQARAELGAEIRRRSKSEALAGSWRDRWQAWWKIGRRLLAAYYYRLATIFGVFMLLSVMILPFAMLVNLREQFGLPTYVAWVLLASASSLFVSCLLLADNLPEQAGWRVLFYPVPDRTLADFISWRVPAAFLVHLGLALVTVVLLSVELQWRWQLGISLAVLQALYLTSIQLIGLRFSLPDYHCCSSAVLGMLFAVLLAGIAALILAGYAGQWLPSALPFIPLTWCVWVWMQWELGQFWSGLLLLPVAVIIGFGFYARYSLPKLTTRNVLESKWQEAIRQGKGVRQGLWFRSPLQPTRNKDRSAEELVALRIAQLTSCDSLPLLERLVYRDADRWVVPQAFEVYWSRGWLWTLTMLALLVPVSWLAVHNPRAQLGIVTLVALIGLSERGLRVHTLNPWYFPVKFMSYSKVVFRRQSSRILVYGLWLAVIASMLGCFARVPVLESLVAMGLAVTIIIALVPAAVGMSFLRCTLGEERLEILFPYAVILLAGPAAMFFLLGENDFRWHWGLLVIAPLQFGLSLGFWAAAWLVYRCARSPGTMPHRNL